MNTSSRYGVFLDEKLQFIRYYYPIVQTEFLKTVPMTHDSLSINAPDTIGRPERDPIGEILHLLKLTGTFYCQSYLSAPWGIDVPALGDVLTFAIVTEGSCWLKAGDSDPLLLGEGSLALLSKGAAHEFLSAPTAYAVPLDSLPVEPVSDIYETLTFGGGGAETGMMYGVVRVDNAAGAMLLDLLPGVVTVDDWGADWGPWLKGTIDIIAREARAPRPGGEAIVTGLADVVVIEAIRRWIGTASAGETGWLKAVRDKQIGQAIAAVHGAPAQDWSVGTLASTVGMSRSAFAARFTELMGTPAMQYVTRWRMLLARERLQHSRQPIAIIAHELGYQSEPSFCRAYKRVFREPPGAVRKLAPG